MSTGQPYDVIIVGAGSSGCVLAARLSERPDRRVLLIEAGPHYKTIADFPPELAQAKFLAVAMPGHPNNWSFSGQLSPGRRVPIARGKAVGGSSAVNGTYFVRGRPEDFDGWAAAGNSEWSFEKVLPYFRKAERDLDLSGEAHGDAGPVPVRRPKADELRPATRAFEAACRELRFPPDPDKNDPASVGGVGPIPRNCIDGVRMNTAVTYLAECLSRPNLTILADCEVERVVFEGRRAVGVEARRAGATISAEGREVVLCAGGIKTPQLLQLSGVGPADLLGAHGIAVVQDCPVGRNIQDHPSINIPFRLDARHAAALGKRATAIQSCLNFTAPGSEWVGDLQINCVSASFRQMMDASQGKKGLLSKVPSYMTRPVATLRALAGVSRKVVVAQAMAQHNLQLLCSLHVTASRGQIRIRSASPTEHPDIDLNYFSHPDDLPRMRVAVRTAAEILATSAFQKLGAARLAPGDEVLTDDAALDHWIRNNLGTTFHTSGGARMGPASDPAAVVDQYGRVHGVEGLRVCDLSILPTLVRRGPHATAVMLGERMADFFPAPAR